MILVRAGGVAIHAPSNRWILSFFSSPYLPHIECRAVDISNSYDFGDEALSPIEGIVEKIVRVEAGPGPFEKQDYVILLRCGELWAKLMHVKPSISINERVFIGDCIGRYLRTNFLSIHDLPHIHVEIHRDRSLRPTRALPLEPSRELIETAKSCSFDASTTNVIKLRTVHIGDGYTLLKAIDGGICITTRIGNAKAIPNGYILEIPSYLGLIHVENKPRPNTLVRILGAAIGYVRRIRKHFSLAINAGTSFRSWLYEFTSLKRVGLEESMRGSVFRVDARIDNSRRRRLELLIGSDACIKIDGELSTETTTLKLSSVRTRRG